MSTYSSSNHHHHHYHRQHHLPYTVPPKAGYPMNEDGIPWTGVHPGEDESQPGTPRLETPVGVWSAGHKCRTLSPADALTLTPLLEEGGDCTHLQIVNGSDPGWLDDEPKEAEGSARTRMAGVLQKKKKKKKKRSNVKSIATILCLVLGLAIALAGVLLGIVLLTWTPYRPEETRGCHSRVEGNCEDDGELSHFPSLPPSPPSVIHPHSSLPQAHPMSPHPSHLVADCMQVEKGPPGKECVPVNGSNDEWVNFTEIGARYGDGMEHGGEGGGGGGSMYKAIFVSDTFMASQDLCRRQGGHLVHINSMREQIFLEDYITRLLRFRGQNDRQAISGFWIGARRSRGSHPGTCMFDQWKWVDAYGRTLSIVSGFSAFMSGRPDDQFSPEECLVMLYHEKSPESSYLKWDDVRCDVNVGFKVVCELEF